MAWWAWLAKLGEAAKEAGAIATKAKAVSEVLPSDKTQEPSIPEDNKDAYKPSFGDVSRQIGANLYEQVISKYTQPMRIAGDISGNKSMSNLANRVSDTTGFRSGGKLSYQPEEISREDAMKRGVSEMAQMAHQEREQKKIQQMQREEDERRRREEELKMYYPNLF